MNKQEMEWKEVKEFGLPTEEALYFSKISGYPEIKVLEVMNDDAGKPHYLISGQGEIDSELIIRWSAI